MEALLAWLVVQVFLGAVAYMISRATRPKTKLARSTLDDIQVPTQAEGEPFAVIFGTPARSAHVHVLYYGDLEIVQKEYKDQPVANYHYLTVHLGLSRSGPEAVQQLWYKDVPMWPTLRDETALAADGTALAAMTSEAHWTCFGGWRRDGGFLGSWEILYGASDQTENAYLQGALVRLIGTATITWDIANGWFVATCATLATKPDGYWVGGQFTCAGKTVAIIYHVGDEIHLNGGNLLWVLGTRAFTVLAPATAWTNGPAYRGIVSLLARHAYWGVSPVLGMVSALVKRTQQLTDGSAMWYIAKADISGDLNPAHILRECFTEPTWGEGLSTDALGTSWTTVADALYTESFGLSFRYLPEPGALQDFVDLVLEHISGYIWRDRSTGKIELGLARDDYLVEDLTTYDRSDFEIVDWHTPAWHDLPGRVVLKYGNRTWPDQTKTTVYDDIAVQAKQAGRVNEKVVDMPGIFSDTLAATVVNRLGRGMCRILSLGTLRAKRTMADLHRGSVFVLSYDDPDLAITQMVVRVMNIKYGPLGDDALEIDIAEDVWASAYTIYGTPGTPLWQPPPIEPDETAGATGTVAGAPTLVSGTIGLGTDGDMAGAAGLTGTWTDPSL